MSTDPAEPLWPGALADNLVRFARVLRAAGMRVGPAATLDSLQAVGLVNLGQREDVKACLRAVFVHSPEDRTLFEHAFRLFFTAPSAIDPALALLLPASEPPPPGTAAPRRVTDALQPPRPRLPQRPPPPKPELNLEATLTWSASEVLRTRDFAQMSAAELDATRRQVARLRFADEPLPIRRTRSAPRGKSLDRRQMLRTAVRSGGDAMPLCFRAPRTAPPPLVILCDISGSMARYTEMLLRFIHALAAARRRVGCFLMGTRLTAVTRTLRGRDIDAALGRCGRLASDWGGGTRLGPCLREFNQRWSRRVLGQGAIVLLITDGLERDSEVDLGAEAARLQRSCRRLVWLNPLLGFDGFQPRAQGIRALLPHVDEFRPVHNLQSLEELAAALARR